MKKINNRYGFRIRTALLVIFFLLIALMVGLLNTFPTMTSRNLVFSDKKTSMMNQAVVLASSLSGLEVLEKDGVSQVMLLLDSVSYDTVAVTNERGAVIYQTGDYNAAKSVRSEICDRALDGNMAFSSDYDGNAFISAAAIPVVSYGTVIGSVFFFEIDTEQAQLISEAAVKLRTISIITAALASVFILIFTHRLTSRITNLVRAMRIVRQGDYSYRVKLQGHDEVTELGDEFNEMTQRLQNTETLRRQFVSDASHELRTPLASIRLLSDSIADSENMDIETMREFVSDIGGEAERLQRLTEKLMKLTKLDSGIESSVEPIDLKKIVERVVHLQKPLAKEGDISVFTDLAEGCIINGNRDDLFQIFFNISENALKYNSFGGNVFITLSKDDKNIRFTVEDTGSGIPEKDLPYIFDRFYRVDKARSREAGGSGLGLAIVADTVKKHGGTVEAANRSTVGARFTVTFPAEPLPAERKKEQNENSEHSEKAC